ncbi:MAG: 3-dehydroquinate synthase, partial [Verrucomicrobiota bacterium]
PWFEPIQALVESQASKFCSAQVPSGEESKSLNQFAKLCSQMADKGFSRKSLVVAVGGGVVGDLAGYLASSYLRGVDFIQVPTTLLAMVDSSVGGKTGVNLPEGKNLVGAFYQPKSVWIDLALLTTLSSREFSAGMAEVIKYGMIRDPEILDMVENGAPEDLKKLVTKCVEIKRDVVVEDEREVSRVRAILNFGHTIGHAIEQTFGYGHFLHGEAISIGMVGACKLSETYADLDPAVTKRLEAILRVNKLPTRDADLDTQMLEPVIARDKKSTGKQVHWVLCSKPGETMLNSNVTRDELELAIQYCSE